MSKPIVIVGAGLAGTRAAEAIREQGYEGPVLMLGAEQSWPYERPALSKQVLLDEGAAPSSLWLQPENFYREHEIELRRGVPVNGLQLEQRLLWLASGESISWDRLVIATGSTPRALSVPGAGLSGVRTLRTWDDAVALREQVRPGVRVVVVGGGLLGLEVASAAIKKGAEVTVLERGPALLSRCVGRLVGASLVRFVQAAGVKVRLHAQVERVIGRSRAEAVLTTTAERHEADLVVVALGVKPATQWLEGSGLALGDGVNVDQFGRASSPGVFAAGDVASVWSPSLERYVRGESYAFAAEHGFAVGQNVLGAMKSATPSNAGGTELFDRRLQFSGDHREEETCHLIGEPALGRFVALLARGGVLVGRVALGQPHTFRALAAYVGQPVRRAFEILGAAPEAQL